MNALNTSIWPVLTAFAVFAYSCQSPQPEEDQETQTDETAQTEEMASPIDDLRHFKFHKTIANIPYPAADVYLTVKRAGAAFNMDNLHPSERFSGYVTSQSKALAFGIYSVDLVYLAMFDRQSELKRYFAVTHALANELDMQEAFEKAVSSNVVDNMENTDTVMTMINDMYGEVDGYLRSNERLDAATSMLLGSWVEAQYLSLSIVSKIEESSKGNFGADYGQSIFDQKLTIYNLLNMLEEYESNPEFAPIIFELRKVNEVYAKIGSPDEVEEHIPALLERISAVRAVITQ